MEQFKVTRWDPQGERVKQGLIQARPVELTSVMGRVAVKEGGGAAAFTPLNNGGTQTKTDQGNSEMQHKVD